MTTSQRIVDVIMQTFEVCAASQVSEYLLIFSSYNLQSLLQGCMNNITFGDENVGYYETVAGGAGAVSRNRESNLKILSQNLSRVQLGMGRVVSIHT